MSNVAQTAGKEVRGEQAKGSGIKMEREEKEEEILGVRFSYQLRVATVYLTYDWIIGCGHFVKDTTNPL